MKEFKKLVEIVEILRSPQGCRWDRAQKLKNLKTYLLEETYELIDALESKDTEKIKEELGDLFLILVFFSQIFKEKKKFDVKEILEKINKKLIGRHPHVFGKKKLKNKEEILNHWIKKKAKDKKRKTLIERLPKSAPSLLLSYLFFKENLHLGRKRNIDSLVEEINDFCKKLKDNLHKKLLVDLIVKIVELSSYLNIDMENLLRKKILSQAKKLTYFR